MTSCHSDKFSTAPPQKMCPYAYVKKELVKHLKYDLKCQIGCKICFRTTYVTGYGGVVIYFYHQRRILLCYWKGWKLFLMCALFTLHRYTHKFQ